MAHPQQLRASSQRFYSRDQIEFQQLTTQIDRWFQDNTIITTQRFHDTIQTLQRLAYSGGIPRQTVSSLADKLHERCKKQQQQHETLIMSVYPRQFNPPVQTCYGYAFFHEHKTLLRQHVIKQSATTELQGGEDPRCEAIFYTVFSKDNYPGLIRPVSADILPLRVVLITDYVHNGSLETRLLENFHGTNQHIKKIFTSVCYSIDYLHNHMSTSHLDIKPDNILLDADSNAIVFDLGMASQTQFSSPEHVPHNNLEDYDFQRCVYTSRKIDELLTKVRRFQDVSLTVPEDLVPRFSVPFSYFFNKISYLITHPDSTGKVDLKLIEELIGSIENFIDYSLPHSNGELSRVSLRQFYRSAFAHLQNHILSQRELYKLNPTLHQMHLQSVIASHQRLDESNIAREKSHQPLVLFPFTSILELPIVQEQLSQQKEQHVLELNQSHQQCSLSSPRLQHSHSTMITASHDQQGNSKTTYTQLNNSSISLPSQQLLDPTQNQTDSQPIDQPLLHTSPPQVDQQPTGQFTNLLHVNTIINSAPHNVRTTMGVHSNQLENSNTSSEFFHNEQSQIQTTQNDHLTTDQALPLLFQDPVNDLYTTPFSLFQRDLIWPESPYGSLQHSTTPSPSTLQNSSNLLHDQILALLQDDLYRNQLLASQQQLLSRTLSQNDKASSSLSTNGGQIPSTQSCFFQPSTDQNPATSLEDSYSPTTLHYLVLLHFISSTFNHRDTFITIKHNSPQHIFSLLTPDIDHFGICGRAESIGTITYQAPENANRRIHEYFSQTKADIYSLGLVLLRLMYNILLYERPLFDCPNFSLLWTRFQSERERATQNGTDIQLCHRGVISEILHRHYPLYSPSLMELMEDLLCPEFTSRPTIKSILSRIEHVDWTLPNLSTIPGLTGSHSPSQQTQSPPPPLPQKLPKHIPQPSHPKSQPQPLHDSSMNDDFQSIQSPHQQTQALRQPQVSHSASSINTRQQRQQHINQLRQQTMQSSQQFPTQFQQYQHDAQTAPQSNQLPLHPLNTQRNELSQHAAHMGLPSNNTPHQRVQHLSPNANATTGVHSNTARPCHTGTSNLSAAAVPPTHYSQLQIRQQQSHSHHNHHNDSSASDHPRTRQSVRASAQNNQYRR